MRTHSLFIITIFLLLVLAIITGGYRLFRHGKESATREKYHELDTVAEMKLDQVVAWRREYLRERLLFLKNPFFSRAVSRFLVNPASAALRTDVVTWLAPLRDNPTFHSMVLFDRNLSERLTIGAANAPVGKLTRDTVAKAVRFGSTAVTDFHYGEAIPRIHLDVVIPLSVQGEAGEERVGVVLVRVDPSLELYPRMEMWPVPSRSAETYLVRREGNAVVFLNELRHRKGEVLSVRLPLTKQAMPEVKAAQGHEGHFQGIDYRGKPVFAVVRKVPGADWFLVAKIDTDEVLAPLRQEAWIVGLGSVLVILLAGMGIGLIRRHESARYFQRLYREERAHHALSQHVERLSRLYLTQSHVNKAVVRCRERQELFGEVCRSIVEDGGFRMAWIGIVEQAGAALRPVAFSGHTDGYLERVRVSADSAPSGLGPSGRAVREGRHVVCQDIGSDLSMKPWREEALRRGYRASAAFPLCDGPDCIGALNVYAAQANFFDGEMVALLDEIAADISYAVESLRTAEMLHATEKRFQQISELMTDFAYSCVGLADRGFALDWLTGAVEEITGYSVEEVLQRGCWGFLVKEEDTPLFTANVADLTFRETGICELRIRAKDGTVRWLHSFCTCVEDDATTGVRRIVGACRDISDRKRVEQDLVILTEELEKRVTERTAALESFSYTVSHDLRAPLRAIRGFTEILVNEHAGSLDAEGCRLLNFIYDNAERMKHLIDDLLAFSRVGRSEINRFRVDMTSLVRDTIRTLAGEAGENTIQFRVGTLPEAVVDCAMFRQVWTNLLSNAVKFSRNRDDAVIEVGAFSATDESVYFVKDTGVGFPGEYAHTVFGLFQRLHSNSEFEGTGVGLAIVKLIVERHGGRVWAEGAEGEGATFYFSLPGTEVTGQRGLASSQHPGDGEEKEQGE